MKVACLRSSALLLSLTPALSAQAREVPCPLRATGEVGAYGSVELELDTASALALQNEWYVTLVDAPLVRGTVDLELQRIPVDFERTRVQVNGRALEGGLDQGDLSLWKGRIAGIPESTVMLGISTRGSYGWIFDGVTRTHLMPAPGEDGDWSRARLVREEAMQQIGPEKDFSCAVDQVTQRSQRDLAHNGGGSTSGVGTGTLVAPIAVETDYQLFQVFGDLGAEMNYVAMLMAAVSDRFLEQVDVRLVYPYMAFYDDPNDPWTSQDSGGGCGDVLNEFRNAWAGNIPEGAALAHFLSGASLGCGVAWLDVLCNEQWGFSLSCCINGGVTFPVQQGNNTWDFFVVAHELGHNFGSIHTHDFCPPLDQCAGNCTGTTQCTNQGTNMSYCHGCSGGMSNITTYFHPTVVDVMRERADASCLEPACGADSYCLAAANSFSATGAHMDWGGSTSVSANNLVLYVAEAVPNQVGLFFYGAGQQQLSFGNGWLCIDPAGLGIQRLMPVSQANPWGENQWDLDVNDPPTPNGQITAGSTWNFQYWFRDPMGGGSAFNLSDALDVLFCP